MLLKISFFKIFFKILISYKLAENFQTALVHCNIRNTGLLHPMMFCSIPIQNDCNSSSGGTSQVPKYSNAFERYNIRNTGLFHAMMFCSIPNENLI